MSKIGEMKITEVT